MSQEKLMQEPALVSVIIPVYNCERYLAEAIESILVQTYSPVEVIVVDDGSTDGSAEVVKRFSSPVRYALQPHSGSGAARNLGVELARGEFLAFLDSDDLWTENKLAQQMAAFEAHPEADIISGHIRQFVSPELSEQVKSRVRCTDDLIPGCVVGTMLIKREAFFRIGLFETNWQVGEVMSWYLRATDLGLHIVTLPDCVYLRRLHETNKGITHRQFIAQRARILKASLDRRREAAKARDQDTF
jgi:glycosyltransferase involved in cell wall biosynthesis